MTLRIIDSNINYKKTKLSRKTPFKQGIGKYVAGIFYGLAAVSFCASLFIETPITGYVFDGYNLENAERNGNTYELYYGDNVHYELTFEDLKKEYDENQRYCVDLDNRHSLFVTPIIDECKQNAVDCVAAGSLGLACITTGLEISPKKTQRR